MAAAVAAPMLQAEAQFANSSGILRDAEERRLVVFAVDDTGNSLSALKWGLDNVVREGDRVHVIYVQPFAAIAGFAAAPGPFSPSCVDSELNTIQHHSKEVVQKAVEVCSDRANVDATSELFMGEPREVIVQTVDKLKASVLVIGSRGDSTFQWLMHGNLSSYLLKHVSCRVIVVQPSGRVISN